MLTREDILLLYEQGPEAVVEAILAMQGAFDQRIRLLEERLGLTSKNSSNPPSGDPPSCAARREQARKQNGSRVDRRVIAVIRSSRSIRQIKRFSILPRTALDAVAVWSRWRKN